MTKLGSKSKCHFCVKGRDYRVAAPVLLRFSECTMSHFPSPPPPLPVLEKNAENTRDFFEKIIWVLSLKKCSFMPQKTSLRTDFCLEEAFRGLKQHFLSDKSQFFFQKLSIKG